MTEGGRSVSAIADTRGLQKRKVGLGRGDFQGRSCEWNGFTVAKSTTLDNVDKNLQKVAILLFGYKKQSASVFPKLLEEGVQRMVTGISKYID